MKRKQVHKINSPSFDDVRIIEIYTQLEDYLIAFNLNRIFSINLKKYEDLIDYDKNIRRSYYRYNDGENSYDLSLLFVENINSIFFNNSNRYILIFREDFTDSFFEEFFKTLSEETELFEHVEKINAKDSLEIDVLLENLEIHENKLLKQYRDDMRSKFPLDQTD